MKNRDYKNLAPNTIVHIYNRGNNREKIFYDKSDYSAFLFRIGLCLGIDQETLKKENILSVSNSRIRINPNNNLFKLHAFCLMPNHFHLLIEQCEDTPISKLISQVCTSYAMYINKKYKRVGHVFQDQFKSVLIDNDPQLIWTSAYIHMNPVKDGLVKNPEDYKWSSYIDFISNRNLSIVNKEFLLSVFGNIKDFEKETLNFDKKG
ncbi:MAG: transposase [Candidatus Paceibacterota bacterium]|jgi:REP element-mobilizing transposase RayT